MTHCSLLLIYRNTRWSHQREKLIAAAPVGVQAPEYDWTDRMLANLFRCDSSEAFKGLKQMALTSGTSGDLFYERF